MDLPANRPRVAQKKFWCRFLKCTVRYESHLVTIRAKHFQKSSAICPAFSCHFLPSMPCVPAPCEGLVPVAWARFAANPLMSMTHASPSTCLEGGVVWGCVSRSVHGHLRQECRAVEGRIKLWIKPP